MSTGGVPHIASAAPASQLWAERYDGPVHRLDDATAAGVHPDGSTVFVTGRSRGTRSGEDYATVAYDAASGAELWAVRYDGPANGGDRAAALEVSADGSAVFVTGSSSSTDGNVYATVAYDASTGEELWVRRFSRPGSSDARALGVSADGSAVFVTGGSSGATGLDDYATVAYDAATGHRLWATRYDGPGHDLDVPHALRASPDGSAVFVTGLSAGSTSGYDYATVAYDAATGEESWVKRYSGPGDRLDSANALGVSGDGSTVFVTGQSHGSATSVGYATVAYAAATGDRLWTARHQGPTSGIVFGDAARALAVSPDGSAVFVTGGSAGATSGPDYVTVAYDATTGDRLWAKRYDGPRSATDRATALGVSPDASKVFVTGYSRGSGTGYDYATLGFDAATGTRLWVDRYDGPANGPDSASALVVDPVGAGVIVTGASSGPTSPDYATVAYAVT
jgi:TolB-like protein